MVRVIEYKDGKRYIIDLKMGSRWKVPERKRGGERKGREGRGRMTAPKTAGSH